MTITSSADTPPAETRAGVAALLVPVGLIVVLVSNYPGWIARRSSLHQYFDGVYRSRIVARELILGIANAINAVTGALGGGTSAGFTVGWVTVTGGGYLAACWLLHRHVRGRAASLRPIETFVVVAMAASAASASVLTPYDFLSYALIIATVVAAGSGRVAPTAALAAAAVATRESGLLAVAVIAASCAVTHPAPGAIRLLGRRQSFQSTCAAAARHRPLWAAGGAGLATYLVLKMAFRSGGAVILFQHVGLRNNLTARSGWATSLAVALVAAGRSVAGPVEATLRARRRIMWLLALPYLVVVAIGGIWEEAPRLVMPLVLGEALLVVGATPKAPNSAIPPALATAREIADDRNTYTEFKLQSRDEGCPRHEPIVAPVSARSQT